MTKPAAQNTSAAKPKRSFRPIRWVIRAVVVLLLIGTLKFVGLDSKFYYPSDEIYLTQLAQAISTALWTTVCGLLIAVPALLAFTLYKNIATQRLLESEATVLDLIKTLRGAEVEGATEDEEEEEEDYA